MLELSLLRESDVDIIATGLSVIATNILPPDGMRPTSSTVRRAHAWIALMQQAVSMPDASRHATELAHLQAHIGPVVHTYESYRSDANFRVGPPYTRPHRITAHGRGA